MRLPFWPRSLRGQMIVLVLTGLVLTQLLGFVLSRIQHQHAMEAIRDENTLLRIASVVHLLAETPVDVHERVSQAVSSRPLRLTITSEPVIDTRPVSGHSSLLLQRLAALLAAEHTDIRLDFRVMDLPERPWPPPRPAARGVPLHARREPPPAPRAIPVLAVAVSLGDGRWLNAVSAAPPPEPFWRWSVVLSSGLAAIILSGLLILMVRRITRPLACLTVAAECFGRGEAVPLLDEHGPLDVQETIRAFNQMRTRLERFVQDRTRLLAAISHDLRTPLTALRVRAELLDDPQMRDKMLATLDEMQHMTEATLAFAREDSVQEETRLIDLDALVQSVCDDLSDLGKDVSFCGPGKTPYRCRTVGLKRALTNLVENAVTYGKCARVTLTNDPEALYVLIEDAGPGIAAADMERVFEPFVRLEGSRSRDTGGIGLGLAIARSIVRKHGGEVLLANRQEGGLRVSVRLPQVVRSA